MTPTKEQLKIYHYIKKRKENVLINAKAGSGKSTTIIQASKLLDTKSSKIYLAFNKHIQEEVEAKLPEGMRCKTFHGLGAGAIKRTYGNSIKFDEFKVDNHIKTLSKKWNLNNDKKWANDQNLYLNEIKRFVNLCRYSLTLDKKYISYIGNKFSLETNTEIDHKRVFTVLNKLVSDRKSYDFADMIFLPAIDSKIWMYQYDYVFLDEAQDLNRAQQRIALKILKRDKITKKTKGRLIIVGDPQQSIYAFTGISDRSFEWFSKLKNTKELPLSISFRCGKKIIEEAQKIVPDIQPFEHAVNGIVREGSVLDEPTDGDFVLCRKQLPLTKLFFHYIQEGKKATILGADLGMSLIEMANGQKTLSSMMGYWRTQLKNIEISLRRRGILNYRDDTSYLNLEDKVRTLDFLAKMSSNVSDMVKRIRLIFSDEVEGILLSTVHKAKGLETDRVFIVRPDYMPLQTRSAWEAEQEKNIEYVAITRAKEELVYDHEWKEDEDEN